MHRLHPYPDVQVMFRRLLIATLIGLLAALAVALFATLWWCWKRYCSVMTAGPGQRRTVAAGVASAGYPALGGLTAEPYSGSGNDAASRVHMPPPIIWKPWRPATAVSIRRQAW